MLCSFLPAVKWVWTPALLRVVAGVRLEYDVGVSGLAVYLCREFAIFLAVH